MAGWQRAARLLREGVYTLPIWIAPLLGGTAERPYTLVVAALGALSALWALWALAQRRGQPLRVSWFAPLLLVALVATLLQCVPLPPALRALLAPGSDGALRLILVDLGRYPQRCYALSTDPGATLNEAVRLGGYLCLLVALGHHFRHRGDSRRLARVIYGSAGVVAGLGALAALHVPLPAPLAVPGVGSTRALLPAAFINSNHMAALLGIGATLTLGAVMAAATWRQRAALLALCALLDVALLGTLSRAGLVIGVCGQGAVLLWPQGQDRAATVRRLLWWLSVPAAVGLSYLALVQEARQGLQLRVMATGLSDVVASGSKVQAWVAALPLLRGHFLLGVGRGAFENAFQGVHSLAGSTRFLYLENEWLQMVVDWGVPVAVAVLGLLALALRDAIGRLRRSPSPQRLAALIALGMVGVHNLVDFNLEAGGVAVAVVGLLALVGQPRFTVPPRLLLGLAVLTLLGAGVAQAFWPSHEEDGERLRQLAGDGNAGSEAVVVAGRAAVARHPLDSYLSAVVAARLWQEQRPQAMEWANRALIANPDDVVAQRTAAMILLRHGYRAQATSLLRRAIANGSRLQRLWLYDSVLGQVAAPAQLLATLPETPAIADEVLDFLGSQPAPRWELVRVVGEWGVGLGAPRALPWLAQVALQQHDVALAARCAEELARGAFPPLLLADLLTMLMESGRAEDAERLCLRALARQASPELLLTLALLRQRRGQDDEARSLLERALQLATEPALQARVHEVRADLEARAGNLHRAQRERLEAIQLRTPAP